MEAEGLRGPVSKRFRVRGREGICLRKSSVAGAQGERGDRGDAGQGR